MTKRSQTPAELRRLAEERIGRLAQRAAPERGRAGDEVDPRRLVHELQVHQVELEMQNDELRTSRAEVEALLQRYAELFDFAPIGYFRLDPAGRIKEVNFAGARLLALPRAQVAGRPFDAFVSGRDRGMFERYLASALARDGDAPALVGEFVLLGEPPGAIHARVSAASLAGTPPSALLAVEDVTARRVAEDALREEARRKEEFLAALSHELRNPLAPIQNALVLLQRTASGGDRARSSLAIIDRQVGHLTRIVDDLLDVTRMAHRKIRLQRQALDLGAHVLRTTEDHRPAFDAAGVRLDCAVESPPCWVDADAARVAQVLGNLLGNALKFTNRGGRVDVSVRREGQDAALLVRDTGVGLDEDVIAHLFEPFSQAPQTIERTRGGLGLGLTLVKGLVDLHGGSVSVASKGRGRGAEFVVRLPLVPAPPAAVRTGPDVSLGGRHRILVVDDNEDAAMTLKDVLELGSHVVRVAPDGPSALAVAREFHPDVVICDIGLPGMNGYEVAMRFRAEEDLRRAWLVAMSGYATPEDVQRARQAGFDRHVAKPATLEKLERLFAEVPAPPSAPA